VIIKNVLLDFNLNTIFCALEDMLQQHNPKIHQISLYSRQRRQTCVRKLHQCRVLGDYLDHNFITAFTTIGTCAALGKYFSRDYLNVAKKSKGNEKIFGVITVPGDIRTQTFSWGAASNKGPREYMEDTWCVKEKNDRPFADFMYAGVFDGHGGVQSSLFLSETLFSILNKFFKNSPMGQLDVKSQNDTGWVEQILKDAFQFADGALLDHISTLGIPECWSGSTATICFINKKKLVCANVGDSRAVLGRNGKAVELTQDHRPLSSSKCGRSEIERINTSGGWVVQGRVCGILGVSRAFGDYEFKGGRKELLKDLCASSDKQALRSSMEFPPVVATPDFFEINFLENDEFVILASDGIWDTMNSAQAVTFVSSALNQNPAISMDDIAAALVERAIRSRSQDNIACVIIDLR
jgi:protein phosphatase 1A